MSLHWQSEQVAGLMSDHGIRTRAQLVARLERHGISESAIYRSFDEKWSGLATIPLLTVIAREFSASLAQLVIEPLDMKESA